jgi:hypothetical protein
VPKSKVDSANPILAPMWQDELATFSSPRLFARREVYRRQQGSNKSQ